MAPSNKARAAGVSASSFLDLKAELSRKEEELSKAKASGKVVAAVKRPDKVCKSSLTMTRYFVMYSYVRLLRNRQYGQDRTKASRPE